MPGEFTESNKIGSKIRFNDMKVSYSGDERGKIYPRRQYFPKKIT